MQRIATTALLIGYCCVAPALVAQVVSPAPFADRNPWPEIRKQRVRELLPDAMRRAGVDAWLVLARENANDPLADHVGGENAGRPAAIMFFRTNTGLLALALSPQTEATALLESGVHDVVIAYDRSDTSALWNLITEQLRARNPQKIAVNSSALYVADGLSYTQRMRLQQAIGSELSDRLISSEQLVSEWLAVKLPQEIEIMRRAAVLTDQLMREAYARVVPGQTKDADVARYLKRRIRELQVDDAWAPEQNPNVNSGPDRGHSHATERVIRPGDFIQTDFGIKVYGRWVTDIQRFAYVLEPGASAPPAEALKKWEIAREGSRKVLAALKPGALGRDVDRVQRVWMESNGSLPVVWSTGHPVGYWAHDVGPTLSSRETRPLLAGQLFGYDGYFSWRVPKEGPAAVKTISVEEMAVVTASGAEYLIPPQQDLILIRTPKKD